jgi:AraC family transcriptional regulator
MGKIALEPQILAHARTDSGVAFQLRRDPPGLLDVPGLENVLVSIHVGVPSEMSCRRGGKQYRGKAVHGDIDIIPAQTPSRWEMHDQNDMSLLLSFPASFLQRVANESGVDPGRVEVLNRFQVRDGALENLSWAIKHEIEIGGPSGRLYLDGLVLAFVSRLLARHSSAREKFEETSDRLQGNRLKRVLSLIEEEISTDLSLAQIAKVAGVSTTHLQTLFHNAMGLSVRQYVIRRRVERAKALVLRDHMSLADIADAVGFSDQSHMARHMRRVLNVTPRELRSHNQGI